MGEWVDKSSCGNHNVFPFKYLGRVGYFRLQGSCTAANEFSS